MANLDVMAKFRITRGIEENHREQAALLFMEAFDGKIGHILGRNGRGADFIAKVMCPDHVLAALSPAGALLGIAGYKTAGGAFIGGELEDLTGFYGTFGGYWRGMVLSLLERDLEPDSLLMDGICVAQNARGQGIGGALLDAIVTEARSRDLTYVRLDVIDKNPRARALYTRKGFVAGRQQHLGPLRFLFGFKSATTMRLAV